jgi:thioredoxin 1
MSTVKNVTDADFEEVVLGSDGPIVVDFFASWCGPCKLVAPEIEKLAAKYAGRVDVVKLDVDANPATSEKLNIMSIPTIAIFRPGEQPKAVLGFRRLEELEEALELGKAA